jgi:integrase
VLHASLPSIATRARNPGRPGRRTIEECEADAQFHDMPLETALLITRQERWAGLRSELSVASQARTAVDFVAALALEEGSAAEMGTDKTAAEVVLVSQITQAHLAFAVRTWRSSGLAAGTINKRLGCLAIMGVSVSGRRVRRPKVLKWWLKPDVEAVLVGELRRVGEDFMADYVTWTTHTGLRVEESLALRRSDFSEDGAGRVSVTVPGLKTTTAQATLPLGEEAVAVFRSRFAPDAAPGGRMFPASYSVLNAKWQLCRILIGEAREPLATLKALRRSAARYLHVTKGMPLDLMRCYLRHENIATTMEYLRLTGGYGADEFRKWL